MHPLVKVTISLPFPSPLPPCQHQTNINSGANQGIGYETAKNLLLSSPSPSSSPSQTYHVLLACRSLPRGLEAVETLRSLPSLRGTVEALQLDVTDDASVDAAARYVRETYWRVDVLVNNAGVGSLIRGNGGGVRDAMRKVLETNVVGAVSVTEAFMPLLLSYEEEGERVRRRKRLLFLCSTTGSFTYAGDPAHALRAAGGAMDYRTSKAALGMVVMQYYAQLRQKGVFVLGVNPGCEFVAPFLACFSGSHSSVSISFREGGTLRSGKIVLWAAPFKCLMLT